MKGKIIRNIIINNSDGRRAKMFKKFLRFLKENEAYYEYVKIMKSCPSGAYQSAYRGNLAYFFNECPIDMWATSCFVWVSYQIAGISWDDIHSKWKKLVL